MRRFRWPYIVATAVYCAGIFALSSSPDLPDAVPSWASFPQRDKVAHLIIYAGLAALVYLGLVRSDSSADRRARWLGPVVFSTVYGLTDEVHQIFVPHRTFDLLDLLADGAGATIMVAALEYRRRSRRRDGGTSSLPGR